MKQILLTLLVLFLSKSVFSQISKNQWLVGGSGSLSFERSTHDFIIDAKDNRFSISPNVGYFIINKLAVGVRPGYDYEMDKTITADTITTQQKTANVKLSPFARYYVLSNRYRINILADASYNWNWSTMRYRNYGDDSKVKFKNRSYSFAAGPVWFINPTAALELTLNYTRTNDFLLNSDVTVNVGFQLHFGKPKKK